PAQEFGETVLRLKDPDGVIVKLVGTSEVTGTAPWTVRGIAAADAIRRIRGATVLTEQPQATCAFLEAYFGFHAGERTDTIVRMVS
ncbi:hypothetical protein K4H02_24785, partial [Mycobacterium tuberculosis]|nr:hypothetical protein [Mycobacterium tuberculosis]